MSSDLTFFTNEPGATLLDRFKAVLEHVQFFDVLVGYFKTSGFYRLYDALESVEKIRILVGLKLDKKAFEIIDFATSQSNLDFASHSKAKKLFVEHTVAELDDSDDSYEVEVGIKKFIEFLTTDCPNKEEDIARGGNGKKLEFRVYPSEKIHAKVYISRYDENGRIGCLRRAQPQVSHAPRHHDPDIRIRQAVRLEGVVYGLFYLLRAHGDFQPDRPGRLEQPAHVRVDLKHHPVISPYPFEHAVAVEQTVIEDAYLRF